MKREDFKNYEEYRDAQEDENAEREYYEREDREEASRKAVQDFKSISFTGTEF